MNFGVKTDQIDEQLNQLFSSIFLEQRKINKITPAQKEKREIQHKMISEYEQLKGAKIYYDYISSGRGHGPFTELVDGSTKYNLIGALGVNLLGHSHPLYIKAQLEAATQDIFTCTNILTHPAAYEFSKQILKAVSFSRLRHFWYACSGTMANDNALKIIWQKKFPKRKVIAFEKAFAGRSIAQQNITHNKSYSEGMPDLVEVSYVPHYDSQDPHNATHKTLQALDELWAKEGDVFCALCIELVQGEAGFIFGTAEYYKAIFEWARAKGLIIWVDEIQTFARTKNLFAYQMFALDEYVDVVTFGKALQVCGTLYSAELNPQPGLLGGTFNASLSSILVANKILRYLLEGPFYGPEGRNTQIEKEFLNGLGELQEEGLISHPRAIGAMVSFEVGDAGPEITKQFLARLFENGIIAYSAGKNPTRIRFLLPLCLTPEHEKEIFTLIEKTVKETLC